MAEENLTYSKALAEIEETLGLMEREALDVDDLSLKVRRVAELIGFAGKSCFRPKKLLRKCLKILKPSLVLEIPVGLTNPLDQRTEATSRWHSQFLRLHFFRPGARGRGPCFGAYFH